MGTKVTTNDERKNYGEMGTKVTTNDERKNYREMGTKVTTNDERKNYGDLVTKVTTLALLQLQRELGTDETFCCDITKVGHDALCVTFVNGLFLSLNVPANRKCGDMVELYRS